MFSRCKKNTCGCIDAIIFILSVLFAFTLGLIIGALASIIVFISLPAVIAVAVILAVLIIVRLVAMNGTRYKCSRDYDDCD